MLQEVVVKKRKKTRAVVYDQPSNPTPERMAKVGDDFDRSFQGLVTIRNSPLEWAERRHAISTAQYNAGLKYRHHWYHAGLLSNIGAIDLNRIFGTGEPTYGMAASEAQAHHRQQYRLAVNNLGAGKISRTVDDVCCHEVALMDIGAKLGWAHPLQGRAVALEFLKLGLDQLRVMWGMS